MSDKVRGGTPKGATSICVTCRWAQVIRGLNLQERAHCGRLGRFVVFPVENCSTYDDKRTPSLPDMQQIAWEITSRIRGQAGFNEATQGEIKILPPTRYGDAPTPTPPNAKETP